MESGNRGTVTRTRIVAYEVDTYRTTAARLLFETVYEGYDNRKWEALPSHQKWRWIRATSKLCDYLERTVPPTTAREEVNV